MFYLFEIAYKFNLADSDDVGYELTQIIAKDPEKAEKLIRNAAIRGYGRNIIEFKMLKSTPVCSGFITYTTIISDRIYNKFEALREPMLCV